jgi:hypothetical protein
VESPPDLSDPTPISVVAPTPEAPPTASPILIRAAEALFDRPDERRRASVGADVAGIL